MLTVKLIEISIFNTVAKVCTASQIRKMNDLIRQSDHLFPFRLYCNALFQGCLPLLRVNKVIGLKLVLKIAVKPNNVFLSWCYWVVLDCTPFEYCPMFNIRYSNLAKVD